MPHRIVVCLEDLRPVRRPPPGVADALRAELPDDWELVEIAAPADSTGDGGAPPEEARDAVRGAEVYVGPGFPKPLFEAAHAGAGEGRLRWVHSLSAGVGAVLYPEMVESQVVLTNSAGIYAEPMADSALAFLLYFARGLDRAVHAQAARHWAKPDLEGGDSPLRELAGTTLGIVGYGGVGEAVARRALALGMRVVALKRHPEPVPEVEVVLGREGLRSLLRRSDHLVILVPETEETRGMIGAEELALLPPGAVVVNLSRGAVLDEDALAVALRSGALRGAGLDVFDREPLPSGSPLWALPNVLVTPHVSGVSRHYWEREGALLRENLRRYLDGRTLLNRVDKRRGY